MEKLFVYGTLQDPDLQRQLLGREICGVADELPGFEKFTIRLGKNTYPMVRQRLGATVSGVVLALTTDDLLILDEYETEAYRRIRVEVASGTMAWVYCEP